MDFNEFINLESNRYPEYMTQKEVATMLSICKSKTQAIQKRGQFPFEYINTENGRQQQIKTADILRYKYGQICFNEPRGEFTDMLHSYFDKQLRAYPQTLFVSDIRRFTGYAKTTVNNWIERNILKALCYQNQRIKSPQLGRGTIIPKTAFLDFLASPYYRNIARKTTIHKEQAQDSEKLFMSFLAKRGVPNV